MVTPRKKIPLVQRVQEMLLEYKILLTFRLLFICASRDNIIPGTSTLTSFANCGLILYTETPKTTFFILFLGTNEINMHPERGLSKILSPSYALGICTVVGLKEVIFWSIPSSELTALNVFLPLIYLSIVLFLIFHPLCLFKQTKLPSCSSL